MRILRAADRTPAPWKNGGGVTSEVAIWPPGAGLAAFDWRISIAEVAASGAFSAFPGIDRVLTVIAGAGLILSIQDQGEVRLDETSPPLAFPGDAACAAALSGGRIRDLNVMVRRGAYVARVRRANIIGEAELFCQADATLVLALHPLMVGEHSLAAEDAILSQAGEILALRAASAHVVVAEITQV